MQWAVEFLPAAEKDLAALDAVVRRHVLGRIEWLANNFGSIAPVALTGEFKGFYKLRAGDWRVFYMIEWKNSALVISYIERRDKAYKRK